MSTESTGQNHIRQTRSLALRAAIMAQILRKFCKIARISRDLSRAVHIGMGSHEEGIIQHEEKANIKSKLGNYDFIRFTTFDMNGIPRAKLVPVKRALDFIQDGINMYSGMNIYGADSQIVLPPEVLEMNYGNCFWKADLSTLHNVSWLDDGRYKMGQILVEPCAKDSPSIMKTAPRAIARMQIEQLESLGYKVLSGMEWEYRLLGKETKQPVFKDHMDFHHTLLMAEFHSWFCDVATNLAKAGIELETMQTEADLGEFEFTSAPEYGIKSADGYAIMKQGIKEMATLRGWEANFMAKLKTHNFGSGAHFSFSVWDKETGANAFYDDSGPNKLSSMAQHWIAGIIKHAPSLTALCCPTTNCYKRLHHPWVPGKADWGINNRMATLRVKSIREKGTYMENRLPSSLANPYIVMAATLAAGMDGVINKLPCPKPEDGAASSLPHSLQEALQALEADTILVETLGPSFINWFLQLKREVDLKVIEGIEDEKKQNEAEEHLYGRTG